MAYAKYDAILERVRELLEDGSGSIRAISASRFQGGLSTGLPGETEARIGAYAQKPIEASITPTKHPQRVSIVGNVQIEAFRLEVKVIRTLEKATEIDDDLRDAVKSAAAIDSDAIKQVLEWPPNLATTSGGTATDCKALIYQDSKGRIVAGRNGAAQTIQTIHFFDGTCISRPATS